MKNLFKGICLVAALMATFAMVGCGGGGSSSKKTSYNMNVLVDGTPLAKTASSLRATQVVDKITVKIAGYKNGVVDASLKLTDREATYLEKDGKSGYACSVDGLLPGVDYRFSAWKDNDKFMENQLAADELQNGGEVNVTVETTLKTKVYDAWIAKADTVKVTNKSVSNFKKNLTASVKKTTDAEIAALSGVDKDQYTKELNDVANKKEGAKLPEVKEDEINLKDVTVEDKESQPTPTPDTSTITSEKLDAITDWREVDESVITELVTVDNNKAAKMLYRGTRNAQGTKWADMQANGKKRYFVEAKMPATPHHFFVFENNSVLLPIVAFTDGEGKTTFTYSGMTEKEAIGGTVIAYTATLDNKTYIKLVDPFEVKADDAEGVAYDYYLEATDLPEDLANAIADMKGSPVYPNELIKELDTAEGWVEATEELNTLLKTNDNKVVALLFSTEDGLTFKDRMNDDYSIHFEKMAEGYELLQHNSFETTGPAYKFYYSSGDDPKFVYFHKDLEKYNETTGDYENIFFGVYRVSKLVKDGRDYYRAINETDSESDLYLKEKHYFLLTDREITSGGVVTGSRR